MLNKVGTVELNAQTNVKSSTAGSVFVVEYTRDATLRFNLDDSIKPFAVGEAYTARLFVETPTSIPVKESEILINQAIINADDLNALPGAADFLPALQTAILNGAKNPVTQAQI
jgi:hypothetical protein